MKNKMYLFALCLSVCSTKATTDAETVWLTDVTTGLQTDKRGVTSPDLPEQLSFNLKRKTHDLVLNLERNYFIDPDVDIYTVRRILDGQPLLEKTLNFEKEDVAYYQDMENGAVMTARCVKRSSGQCDILINGNIRLGDRSYNLRPSEADLIPNYILEITGVHGKRYVLQDQAHIQSGMSVENNEQTNVIKQNVQEKDIDLLRRIPYGQDKPNLFFNPAVMFSAGNAERLQNTFPRGAINYGRTNAKNVDQATNLAAYYSNQLLLSNINDLSINLNVRMCHISEYPYMLLVDQLYKGIEDPSISMTVSIVSFVIYQEDVPMKTSERNAPYPGKNSPSFVLTYIGRSTTGGICDIGRRVQIVRVTDFYKTTRTAAHRLGHALGAPHDGKTSFSSCRPEYKFMSRLPPGFYPAKKYTLNPWLFSRCSVEAFKRTLVSKTRLTTKNLLNQDTIDEVIKVLSTQPGERWTPIQQCIFSNGHGSKYIGKKLDLICAAMRCSETTSSKWNNRFIAAATGAKCGENKSCQKGLCVQS